MSTYSVPTSATDVYLQEDHFDHSVIDVYLGSLTSMPVAQLDGYTSSNSDTITASTSGVTVHDMIQGIYKPGGGVIFNSTASNCTFEIDPGASDSDVEVKSSSSSGTTITFGPAATSTAVDTMMGGVDHLVFITNAVGGQAIHIGGLD